MRIISNWVVGNLYLWMRSQNIGHIERKSLGLSLKEFQHLNGQRAEKETRSEISQKLRKADSRRGGRCLQ